MKIRLHRATPLYLLLALLGSLPLSTPSARADRGERAPAAEPAASDPLAVSALLVIASKAAGASDPALADYEATLRRVLRFESFRLVGRGATEVPRPGQAALALGADQHLALSAEAAGASRRLAIEWFAGDQSLMRTGLMLRPGVPAVLGGPASGPGEVYAIILTAR
jgi:hypothetical protein